MYSSKQGLFTEEDRTASSFVTALCCEHAESRARDPVELVDERAQPPPTPSRVCNAVPALARPFDREHARVHRCAADHWGTVRSDVGRLMAVVSFQRRRPSGISDALHRRTGGTDQ